MKRLFSFFVLLLALTCFCSSSCKKDKSKNPVDELPAETQTGANTFGCLVEGKVFKPGGAQLSGGSLSCNYQYLGTGVDGGYYFRLVGVNKNNSNGERKTIGLFTDSLKIKEAQKYTFFDPYIKGGTYALYSFSDTDPFFNYDYNSNNLYNGEFWIKKLDTINQIVSGTFWFDAVDTTTGQTVQIREGRFDMRYTR